VYVRLAMSVDHSKTCGTFFQSVMIEPRSYPNAKSSMSIPGGMLHVYCYIGNSNNEDL
jgi:hypothetical protein